MDKSVHYKHLEPLMRGNTVYMAAVLEHLRADGHHFTDDDVVHLSPARYEHINPHGHYRFNPAQAAGGRRLRPLRRP